MDFDDATANNATASGVLDTHTVVAASSDFTTRRGQMTLNPSHDTQKLAPASTVPSVGRNVLFR